MKLKQLQTLLEPLKGFSQPKVMLEQYVTSPHLAATCIFTAASNDDIQGKSVLDLGCGPAILGIAASLCGAEYVLGVDLDGDALEQARENVEEAEVEAVVDLVHARVTPEDDSTIDDLVGKFDTVIMNPPFGTKVTGIDMVFLEKACRIATTSVYSLHKSSTRDFILKKARSWGYSAQVIAQMRYDLPATMRFHKQKTKDIEVDFIHFSKLA